MISRAEAGRNRREPHYEEATDAGVAVRVRARARPDLILPDEDVRLARDRAAARRWAEIARHAVRLLLLVSLDLITGSLAVAHAAVLARPPVDAAGFDLAEACLLLFLQPLALGLCGAYSPVARRAHARRLLGGVALTALLAWVYRQLPGTPGDVFEGLFLPAYAAAAAVLLPAGRWALNRVPVVAHRPGSERVLVLGPPANVALVERYLASREAGRFRVVGRLALPGMVDDGALGTIADLERVLRETGARGVVVPSTLPPEILEAAIRRCLDAGVAVSIVPPLRLRQDFRLVVRPTPSGPLLEVHPGSMCLPRFAIKRALDIVLSLVALAALAPLMLLIAVGIKLDSPGPVILKQRRAGLGGRPFDMYKFRTMVSEAEMLKRKLQHLNESGDPRLFKIRQDPRVTRIGRLLRRTSLDELPQLFNVLRGEMSLVGPRPFFPEDIALYEPHHIERLSVLPGMTGLWQVSGRSDIVDFEEVVQLDLKYIREWSLRMDLSILARTLPAAFGRNGAY